MLRAFLNLNDHDLELSDDTRVELALAAAAGHISVAEVETRIRPAVVRL